MKEWSDEKGDDAHFMQRCIALAYKGGKKTLSNPWVGAVLVHNGNIIGEGYHQEFGQAHAEVNALQSVRHHNRHLIPQATLYVSLEPCAHTGKTPPCSQRIIDEGIKKVVIGCIDPNTKVAGKGVQHMRSCGIYVSYPTMEKEALQLIAKYRANLVGLPFIILKWAQSADNYISVAGKQVWLSNDYTKILTHKWRAEVDAILVGSQTVIIDNPRLDIREYQGTDPIRIILNTKGDLSPDVKVLNDTRATIIVNQEKESLYVNKEYLKVDDMYDLKELMKILFQKGINSVLVEGGQKVLNSFISQGIWHEARIIKTQKILTDGIAS
ncbi:MAG: bifunctional diaminohydroxyphosphoribosylaminopyrimidine deaminase/5-amino-6-(5-phosphoribosylamino)uracil reductase RibD, partial [Saprospiraceae bacterium]